jgi:pimeloyl-ACP methyl ester carboxylesterase
MLVPIDRPRAVFRNYEIADLINYSGPGSFIEVTKLLPLLKDIKDGPNFHVVAPSLPNFGWSSRATKVRTPPQTHDDILITPERIRNRAVRRIRPQSHAGSGI